MLKVFILDMFKKIFSGKNLIFIIVFSILSSLIFSLLINTNYNKSSISVLGLEVFNANPNIEKRTFQRITRKERFVINAITVDFRAIVFEEYLRRNNSPLVGLGEVFAESCIKYDAPKDCTVVLAIAAAETHLCKYPPSQKQKNCWGFGGSGANRYIFNNYEEGIDLVTRRLVYSYGHEYMIDPNKMEMVFCGNRPSCAVWGERVVFFMNQINNLAIELGYGSLYSLRDKS